MNKEDTNEIFKLLNAFNDKIDGIEERIEIIIDILRNKGGKND